SKRRILSRAWPSSVFSLRSTPRSSRTRRLGAGLGPAALEPGGALRLAGPDHRAEVLIRRIALLRAAGRAPLVRPADARGQIPVVAVAGSRIAGLARCRRAAGSVDAVARVD